MSNEHSLHKQACQLIKGCFVVDEDERIEVIGPSLHDELDQAKFKESNCERDEVYFVVTLEKKHPYILECCFSESVYLPCHEIENTRSFETRVLSLLRQNVEKAIASVEEKEHWDRIQTVINTLEERNKRENW